MNSSGRNVTLTRVILGAMVTLFVMLLVYTAVVNWWGFLLLLGTLVGIGATYSAFFYLNRRYLRRGNTVHSTASGQYLTSGLLFILIAILSAFLSYISIGSTLFGSFVQGIAGGLAFGLLPSLMLLLTNTYKQ